MGTTWADKMDFVMNHAPGAGSIARSVGLQTSTLDQLLLTYIEYKPCDIFAKALVDHKVREKKIFTQRNQIQLKRLDS